jgi:hypothetical protein
MQLVKSPGTIESLAKFDDYFKSSGTECWQSPAGTINLYLFSAFYPTVKDLETKYKELRDHIAVSFQSRMLEKAAERWNLYLLLLVREGVPEDLKQRIIQDKFSTRKIVYSTGQEEITDAYINNLVSQSLLDIDIPVRKIAEGSLTNLLAEKHPKIAVALEKVAFMNNRDYIADLLNILSYE